MGDENEPAKPGDEKKPTGSPVEMANDEGADPSSDIEHQNSGQNIFGDATARGNVHSEKADEPELQASEAHPS